VLVPKKDEHSARTSRVADLGYVVVASRINSLLARYCGVQDRIGDGS